MINRTIVRTQVIRTLFAYYKDGDKTVLTAQKEMLEGFSNTYYLYLLLLDLVNELTHYAETRIELAREKAVATHTTYNPSLNFVENKFASQIFENRQLRNHLEESKLSWEAAYNNIELIYKEIVATDFYQQYLKEESPSYESDKQLWRKIYSEILPKSVNLENALEDVELAMPNHNMFLAADLNIILSFVIKTIKQFKSDSDKNFALLDMFKSEDELDFAKQLLSSAIENREQYAALIDGKLRNWDPERVAYMDRLIMQVALAEILTFDNIAVEVSLNEYIEIAREYSTDSSPAFINGILDQIVFDLRRDKAMPKFAALRKSEKK